MAKIMAANTLSLSVGPPVLDFPTRTRRAVPLHEVVPQPQCTSIFRMALQLLQRSLIHELDASISWGQMP